MVCPAGPAGGRPHGFFAVSFAIDASNLVCDRNSSLCQSQKFRKSRCIMRISRKILLIFLAATMKTIMIAINAMKSKTDNISLIGFDDAVTCTFRLTSILKIRRYRAQSPLFAE